MRITFNLQGVGLANNGGSATIVNSANVLSELGHKVYLVSEKENMLDWVKIDRGGPKYIKTNGAVASYPDAHVLVATGAFSVQHVLNAPSTKGSKFWWVRAHESWAMSEDKLLSYYRNPYIQPLVNSIGLRTFILRKTGRNSEVMRSGMDLKRFRPTISRNWQGKAKFVLGGLHCNKSRKRTNWITEIYETCKARKIIVELNLFGDHDKLSVGMKAEWYLRNPSGRELCEFYNGVDIWLAPTKSEGLHMPPQEAMLCGCVVIGADELLSGMRDYLTEKHSVFGRTGFFMNHWSDAVDLIEQLWWKDRDVLQKVSENGRRMILSMGDRTENMKRLVRQFEKGKDPHTLKRAEIEMRRRRGV